MKKTIHAFLVTFFAFSEVFGQSQRVRRIELKNDQIAQVKTALGIATIIQVPDSPNSVVVGNSEAFKVEYLDQAITIKPLFSGARSNLYIYTNYRRYNVELISVNSSEANYIVYLEGVKSSSQTKKPDTKMTVKPIRSVEPYLVGINWFELNKSLQNDEVKLIIKRVGLSANNVVLFDFTMTASQKIEIKPENLSINQNKKIVTIHNLFLSSLKIDPQKPITGTLEILKSDLKTDAGLNFEFKRKNKKSIYITEVSSWKKLKKFR